MVFGNDHPEIARQLNNLAVASATNNAATRPTTYTSRP